MSTHEAAGGAAGHAAHDHGFDGEPAQELPEGEPHTPGWLPVLGAALFVAASVYMLAISHDEPVSGDAAHPAQTGAAPPPEPQPQPQQQQRPAQAAQAAQPAQRRVEPIHVQPGSAEPPGHAAAPNGTGPLRNMAPDELARLKQVIERAKQQKAQEKKAAP